ncbi:3-ketoacyl-CoA thiolase, peroxisomal [Perkinsus olseni]|uniref:acetyl-CoA C-acyltransferase n=1 Tax=Perkinsus olseni TaxID=32597 RepID=A0A7J6PLC0_PEROL|nr:3-ketoacyl-CoA thiolase, peroxisomal [Perkinsus olseni]
MNRVDAVSSHVCGGPSNVYRDEKRSDDVVICAALRTALCKARAAAEHTLVAIGVVWAAIERTGVDPHTIGDIQISSILQPGPSLVPARMAALMAGIPVEVPADRQCSNGILAVANVASRIKAGYIRIGIAAGVESMSKTRYFYAPQFNNEGLSSLLSYDLQAAWNMSPLPDSVARHEAARSCITQLGTTSENVASRFGITREAQDRMAVESHRKACKAQRDGLFDEEIVPVETKVVDSKTGESTTVTVTRDEGCRPDTTLEGLASLRPAFSKDGCTTAGNASQMTDGAACVFLARYRAFSAVGVPPEIMGVGPAAAIPAVLAQTGLGIDDIDIFEVNEAFASQATYCVNKLKIPAAKLNPKGGAIALGHPLAATGIRQIVTLLPELKRRKGKIGVVSMCIGGGLGAALVIFNEQ